MTGDDIGSGVNKGLLGMNVGIDEPEEAGRGTSSKSSRWTGRDCGALVVQRFQISHRHINKTSNGKSTALTVVSILLLVLLLYCFLFSLCSMAKLQRGSGGTAMDVRDDVLPNGWQGSEGRRSRFRATQHLAATDK